MSFPTEPTNGQVATINNIDYIYDSTAGAWSRQPISNPNGSIFTRIVNVPDATSITVNADITDLALQLNTQPAQGTLTINAPTGTLRDGQKLLFRIKCTNVQTMSWNAVFNSTSDLVLPTSTTGGLKFDYFGVIYNSAASKWDLVAKVQAGSIANSVTNSGGITGTISGGGALTLGSTANSSNSASTIVQRDSAGSFAGNVITANTFSGSTTFLPVANSTYDLGSSSLRWRNIYTQDLHLSNGIGDYTLIEGKEELFLVNNLSGKSFKFALIEVDPKLVPPRSKTGDD